MVGLALLPPALRRDPVGLWRGAAHGGRSRSPGEATLAPAGDRREPRRVGVLQVHGFLPRQPSAPVPGCGHRGAASGNHPAGGCLVLHLPVHFLPHRRVPRNADRATGISGLHAVRGLLPAVARRPHRARRAVPAADGERAPVARGRPAPGDGALHPRLRQEGPVRRHAGRVGGPGVRASGGLYPAHLLARGAGLHGADLLRLLRVHRHGDRRGAHARHHATRRTSATPMPPSRSRSSGSAGT